MSSTTSSSYIRLTLFQLAMDSLSRRSQAPSMFPTSQNGATISTHYVELTS